MKKTTIMLLLLLAMLSLFAAQITVNVSTRFIGNPPKTGTVSAWFEGTCREYDTYDCDRGYTFQFLNSGNGTYTYGRAVINGHAVENRVPYNGYYSTVNVSVDDSSPINPPAQD